jgi:hypothetical protein
MSPFRRVPDGRAGPDALGILVPPGHRTVVILRPRSLAWDLLLRSNGANGIRMAFQELGREEAATVARRVFQALEAWAVGGPGQVTTVPSAGGEGYHVQVEVGEFTLVACLRIPGQPYQPLVFGTPDEAGSATARLHAVLCPPAGAEQPFYFNTQNFSR